MPDTNGNIVRGRAPWSSAAERVTVQVIHWLVVIIVAVLIFVLALRKQLDHASVTALYGGILGHAGTAASQKLSNRSHDGRQDHERT